MSRLSTMTLESLLFVIRVYQYVEISFAKKQEKVRVGP